MNKKKNVLILVISMFILALVYTLLVKNVDTKAIGPGGSVVGFSSLNKWFHDLFSYSSFWYKLTKYLGFIPFLFVAYYGLCGLLQLIDKKSIAKVDKKIICLGIFYVLVGITYVFFEKVIINYRPVMLEGELEASYPSSHTMLAVCICLSSLLISKDYIKNIKIRKIVNDITWLLMVVLVVGRSLSGVHWISDIIGGVIISLFLVSIFYYLIFEEKKKKA